MQLTNRETLLSQCYAVRVIHVTPRDTGGYLAGCEFDRPLPYHQVRALIGGA